MTTRSALELVADGLQRSAARKPRLGSDRHLKRLRLVHTSGGFPRPPAAARRASWTRCGGLAAGSPVGVMTKQPPSWWMVEEEPRLSKRHDEVVLEGERVIGPYDQKSCRVLMQTPGDGGPSGSRAPGEKAKATDDAETLEVQHPTTHGRMGSRTITQPTTEHLCERGPFERAVPTASAGVGGGHTIVVTVRTTQPHWSEGPPAECAFGTGLAAGLPMWTTNPLPVGNRPDRPRNAWASIQRSWHGGVVLAACPGASRVREKRMQGSGRGCWGRARACAWAPRQRPTSREQRSPPAVKATYCYSSHSP